MTLSETRAEAGTTTDILAVAREQVLERGERLTEAQLLEVMTLPDERLEELLALAHDVRMKWCGPDVEVAPDLDERHVVRREHREQVVEAPQLAERVVHDHVVTR